MSIELELLQALSHKDNYKKYEPHINYKRLMEDTRIILTDYGRWFDLYKNKDQIDFGSLATHFTQDWHKKDLDDDDIDYYVKEVFPRLEENKDIDCSRTILSLHAKQTADLIADNVDDIDKVQEYVDSYKEYRQNICIQEDEEAYTIDKVDFSVLDKDKGIPWFLPSLQRGLGSLVQGQFVVVSADYGTGKSAFIISQAVKAFKHLKDSNRPILYFNSEGTQADVFGRFLSNLYSAHIQGGFEEVFSRIDEVRDKFCETYPHNNFMVFQISVGAINKIRAKIEQYKPALVFIDICDVLAPEEDVMNLKKLYDHIRLLSGEYCPIIGTTQSGDTSYRDKEGNTKTKKWLNEKALYGSKAGKGGAADTIITIGKDDEKPNIRYVHTPKKKRGEVVSCTCEIIDKFSLYRELI